MFCQLSAGIYGLFVCAADCHNSNLRQHKHNILGSVPGQTHFLTPCLTRKRLEDVSLVELARFKTSCAQEVQSALSSAAWTPFKCTDLTEIQQDFVWRNHISITGLIMFLVLFVFRSNLVEGLVKALMIPFTLFKGIHKIARLDTLATLASFSCCTE